jgi:hypothetical protein
LLVRAGPALGPMGTLIPLSPALTGLANANTAALSTNPRVAFSVTVVGLLISAVAFGLSLARDRMYGQDPSDLEYLAATVSDPRPRRSRSREDRAGDPLDGLGESVRRRDRPVGGVPDRRDFVAASRGKDHGERPARDPAGEITIGRGQTVAALPRPGPRTIGRGTRAGVLYRLSNGRLVYVQNAPNQENP